MALADKIDKMIRRIGHKTGTALPGIDKNGVCSMIYNNKFEFNIEVPRGDHYLYLYSPLLKNIEGNCDFHKRLLEMNFKCSQTDGATISWDNENEDVVLCRQLNARKITEEQFSEIINAFLTTAERCYSLVTRLLQEHWTKDRHDQKPSAAINPTGIMIKV